MLLDLSKELPKNILAHIYNTLILPYVTYCSITWGFTNHTYIHRLSNIQQNAIRIIIHSTTCSYPSPLFKRQQFLNTYQIIKLHATFFMFGLLNNIFSNIIDHKFLPSNKYHSCKTRINLSLRAHFSNLDICMNTIFDHGTKIWSNLSPELIHIKNRKKLKKLLNITK